MATYNIVLDASNSNTNTTFDYYWNGTADIINVYITVGYEGNSSQRPNILAGSNDTINFIIDPAYRPTYNTSLYYSSVHPGDPAYLVITGSGSPTYYVEINGGSGSIDDGVFLGNTNITSGPPPSWYVPPKDYTVEGTGGSDVITTSYTGDPEGDRVDNSDAANGSQDDLIEAYGGNDYIDSRLGRDTVYAGTGNDTIYSGADRDTVYAGSGNDTIDGGAGADRLYGEGGNDRFLLNNGFGADLIYGGETSESTGDVLDMSGLTTGVTVNLTSSNPETGTVNDGSSTASFYQIENIILGGGRDTVVLADGSGADSVQSFDMTDSGDGTTNDQLDVSGLTSDGGTTPVNTNDVVVTDTNGDGTGDAILTFPGGESITLIGVSPSQLDTPEELEAIGIPAAPPDGTVEGTAGDDLIDFAYTGDPDGDMVDANDAADGSNDDVIEAGDGDDRVRSGSGDDTVFGGAGNDYIETGTGNDIIYGGAGNDNYDSDFGNDTFYGGDGDDWVGVFRNFDGETLFGGETDETLGDMLDIYGQAFGDQSATTVVLTGDDSGTAVIGGTETATFDGFERFILRSGDDVFDGTISTENLSVHGGYSGAANNNLFMTGSGNDTLDAKEGDDTLDGGAGDDTLLGGAGNDTLIGGTGNDTLTGGDGDDIFVYQPGDGVDVITDFGAGNTGTIDDGDQQNNDLVDLSAFYNSTTLADVNANGGNFTTELGMLRADAADGTLDGVIDGVDYSAQIGGINLTIENAGVAVTGTDLTFDNTNVVCFTSGTLIETDRGPIPIEDISVGDLVLTKDDGLQPVRWIGSRKVGEDVLCQYPNLRPIRIAAQSLGCGLPKRDLLVSPQHRMLIRSQIADRMFGESEVLVAAKHLTAFDGIEIAEDQPTVTYWHFMFDRHQVVFAEGAESESLYAGKEALSSIPIESLREIHTLFPEVSEGKVPSPARKLVKGRQGRRLAERHHTNRRPLFQSTLPKPGGRHEVRI